MILMELFYFTHSQTHYTVLFTLLLTYVNEWVLYVKLHINVFINNKYSLQQKLLLQNLITVSVSRK
jgi:hypothetical protein